MRLGQAKNRVPHFSRTLREVGTFSVLLVTLLLTSASAQTLTGKVTNGTTNKPAAGDDVVLLSLGQGMQESGRTQTDAKGNFSVKLDDADESPPGPRHSPGRDLSPHGAAGNDLG